jgi:hypothetical protein
MRLMVKVLVADKPAILWQRIANFYEVATPIERNRMRRIVGPDRDRFDNSSHAVAGPLFGIPEEMLVEWADQREDRPALLLDFYPVLTFPVVGPPVWHPSLIAIANRYGRLKLFRQALESRMYPRSWSGSIVPTLEIFLEPLRSWLNHPNCELAL